MRLRYVLPIFAALCLNLLVVTGAFAGGDETVRGVYLNPADTSNGETYAEIGSNGEVAIDLANLNPKSTTTFDSVLNVISTTDGILVWIESESDSVNFYRMDTQQAINSRGSAANLSSGEVVLVGMDVESGVSNSIDAELTVHALIPTKRPEPTTRSAGGSGGGGGGSGGSGGSGGVGGGDSDPAPTQSPVATTAVPTSTPSPTQSPTETARQPTDQTDEGTTVRETGTVTETAPPDGNETKVPPATSPPPAEEPQATETPADERDRFELGGLSLPAFGALLIALVGLPLLLWGLGWFRGSPALVVTVDTTGGLRVSPGHGEEDHYATGEDTVTFAFADSEAWDSRDEDTPVRFEGVVTLSNATEDPLVVTPDGEEETLDSVRVFAGEAQISPDGFRLSGGAERAISVEFPSGFDPDDDVTVFFDTDSMVE